MSFCSRALILCSLGLFMAVSSMVYAADGGETPGTPDAGGGASTAGGTSTYGDGGGSPFSIPSGLINLKSGANQPTFNGVTSAAPSDEDQNNLQGCGGVTQSDYTSGLYNMPEVFNKFQKDVNTDLARQILTYNYSLPQTAALFDTLNNYGNARYQQFQQGCSLDTLRKEAKNQFLNTCVKDQISKRKAVIDKIYQNDQSGSDQAKFTDAEKEAQAYAQAWELCSNQYVSDTTTLQLHKDVNKAFAETVRKAEDVNAALKPLLCDAESAGGAGGSAGACWPMLFLPQVRVCNGESLDAGCTDTSKYGIKEAPLTASAFFDFLSYTLKQGIVSTTVNDFYSQLNRIQDNDVKSTAANIASSNLIMSGITDSYSGDANVKKFQQYINCKSNDFMYPLKKYSESINAKNAQITQGDGPESPVGGNSKEGAVSTTTPKDFGIDKYNEFSAKVTLPAGADTDKAALGYLAQTTIGCTINQVVPMVDPKIIASIATMCTNPDDRSAFYTMASYDVALNASRDVYRYLDMRLKQTYGRLLNESGIGVSGTLPAASGGATGTIDSPELRRRLASAVKEIMLPAVESQLARLDELNGTRGQFAQRVQKIYAERQGCVYNQSAPIPVNFQLKDWSNE